MKAPNSISFDNQPSSNRQGTPMETGETSLPIPTPKAPLSVSRPPASNKVVPDPTLRKGIAVYSVYIYMCYMLFMHVCALIAYTYTVHAHVHIRECHYTKITFVFLCLRAGGHQKPFDRGSKRTFACKATAGCYIRDPTNTTSKRTSSGLNEVLLQSVVQKLDREVDLCEAAKRLPKSSS